MIHTLLNIVSLQQGNLLMMHLQVSDYGAENYLGSLTHRFLLLSRKLPSRSQTYPFWRKNVHGYPVFLSEQKEFVPKSPAFFFQGSLKHDV